VTGENLDLMKMFLNLLSTRLVSDVTAPAEFQIDDTFSVPVSVYTWNSLTAHPFKFLSVNLY